MQLISKFAASAESLILKSKHSIGVPLNLAAEKEIFSFHHRDASHDWVTSSDESIGGSSTCDWTHSLDNLRNPSNADTTGAATEKAQYAIFSGHLSMACKPREAGVVRSGYCAVRAAIPKGLNLYGYQGISMRVKTNGRHFRVNAQTEGWNPFHIYMGFFKTPPNEWVDIELAFGDFMLTSKGTYVTDDTSVLDPAELQNIGFAIADQQEGPFQLCIQHIKAIFDVEQRDPDFRLAMEEENQSEDTTTSNRLSTKLKKPAGLSI